MKIWANCVTYNEENFVWFAINSVIDSVDKIIVWDTGSTDNTVQIIEEIKKRKPDKIIFKQYGKPKDRNNIANIRQEMLKQSKCDFIMVLDADEVWWEDSINKIVRIINQKKDEIEGIVVPFYNLVGDIYHYQDEIAGQYKLLGKKGHLQLKFFSKKIPGLHVGFVQSNYKKNFYFEGYYDENNKPIQDRSKLIFVDAKYIHLSHLKRSAKPRSKADRFKLELGNKFEKDFKYPEVFYKSYPEIVPSPWKKMPNRSLLTAAFLTPLRKVKRKLENFKA